MPILWSLPKRVCFVATFLSSRFISPHHFALRRFPFIFPYQLSSSRSPYDLKSQRSSNLSVDVRESCPSEQVAGRPACRCVGFQRNSSGFPRNSRG